ncbi:unnamed protein product [Ectocarpus sp. CCAP 1310/34]|nr:unnamed protein product [Ectocarpus sp. CCAP 1310/34]
MLYTTPVSYFLIYDTYHFLAHRAPIGAQQNALCSHGPQLSAHTILGQIGQVVAEEEPKIGGSATYRGGVSDVPVITPCTDIA